MKTIQKYALAICFLFIALHAIAQQTYRVENIPDPKRIGTGYVSDPDNVLSQSDINTLNELISSLENTSTAQIAVVIVNSIGSANPKDFTYELFNYWKVGQASKDNGLMIFTVLDQRRTEFETGYGLEGVLPDVICYRIGMQELVPYFKEEQYGNGLIATVRRIKQTLESPESIEEIFAEDRTNYRRTTLIFGLHPALFWYLLLSVIVAIIAGSWLINVLTSKQDQYDKYLSLRKGNWWFLLFLFPLPYIIIFFIIRNRMRFFRNAPRFSRVNGMAMRKLGEEEEDPYLDQGQISEEDIKSVDYDVWITEEAEDILILKYTNPFSKYKTCQQCGYKTYSLKNSRVVIPATYSSSGKREMIYTCKNCNYRNVKYQTIPRKQRSSSGGGGGFAGGGGGSSWGGGSSGGGGAGVSW
ncbi:MAG: TPM domain-containing protein [Bacteroidota bacterium]